MVVHNGDLLRGWLRWCMVVVLSTEIRVFLITRMGAWSWQLCSEDAEWWLILQADAAGTCG